MKGILVGIFCGIALCLLLAVVVGSPVAFLGSGQNAFILLLCGGVAYVLGRYLPSSSRSKVAVVQHLVIFGVIVALAAWLWDWTATPMELPMITLGVDPTGEPLGLDILPMLKMIIALFPAGIAFSAYSKGLEKKSEVAAA